MTESSIEMMNEERQWCLVKKRHLCDYHSHLELYHHQQQECEATHHVYGCQYQWTLLKELGKDKLEEQTKTTKRMKMTPI